MSALLSDESKARLARVADARFDGENVSLAASVAKSNSNSSLAIFGYFLEIVADTDYISYPSCPAFCSSSVIA